MSENGKKLKQKLTEFYEDHKTGIAYWTGAAVATVGCAIGVKLYCKRLDKEWILVKRNPIGKVIKNACDNYSDMDILYNINPEGYSAEQLGELGSQMLDKIPDKCKDTKFTHFIGIGKTNK